MTASVIIRAVIATMYVVVCAQSARTTESVYPPGYDISVSYTLNKSKLHPSDTLRVTRTLVNRTEFPLHGLYLSDNFPPSFDLAFFSARRNLGAVSATLIQDPNATVLGNIAYYWVFDDPGGANSSDLVVQPGDSLVMVAKLVCSEPGDYHLPLHATVFFSDEVGGFFAISNQQTVSVLISTDIDDDQSQPSTYLTSQAYPNPFNHTVTIEYAGARLDRTPLELLIYNLLGQVVHQTAIYPENEAGIFEWDAPLNIGSGFYYYRLSSANQTSRGKLVLLK